LVLLKINQHLHPCIKFVAPSKRKTTRSKSKIQRSVGTKSKRSTDKNVKSKKRAKRK
jgi:hypothetical protein